MSLTLPGVWEPSAAWAPTVWTFGVWFEGATPPPAFAATLIPVITRPHRPMMDWSWLEQAYNEALVGSRQLGEEYVAQSDDEEADFEDLTGLEPDEDLFGKRRKKRKRRSE